MRVSEAWIRVALCKDLGTPVALDFTVLSGFC
jgi:hypothetical protein